MVHTGMCADDELTAEYYIDSGRPSISYLRRSTCGRTESSINRSRYQWPTTDRSLLTALDIYGLQLVNGQEREVNLEHVYYAPWVDVRLLSMGKLEDQGWDVRLRMELRDRNGDLFADIAKANKVYPVELRSVASGAELAGWTTDSREGESTYQERLERLGKDVMTATVGGGSRPKASLLTWHRWLGHLSFKTIMELAQGGARGMKITDVLVRNPGLDACSACVAAKMVHLPHKEGRGRATEYLGQVHVDIAGTMQFRQVEVSSTYTSQWTTILARSTPGRYSSNRRRLMHSRLPGQLQRMSLESGCAR